MFQKISSFVLGASLFAVLSGSASNIEILSVSLGILIVATFIINLRRIGLTWPHLLLPTLYLLGTGSLFMVITSPTIRVAFLLVAAINFYFLETNLGRESHLLQNTFLFSAFALYVGIFALNFYVDFSVWLVALLVFALSYLLMIQAYAGFSLPVKKYFYFLTALVLAQIAWGLVLWPTHFMVNAVVVFAIFYLIWILSISAFFGKLTGKKIFLQITLTSILLAAALGSAAWQPLIR